MKKYLSLVLALVLALALIPSSVSAARIGDVIGYAQPTDIVATINGYQIESYNVNGYTYICVEDLRYYGFDVYYDNYTRSLSFNRNYGITNMTPQFDNPDFWSIGRNSTRRPILYTDIVTYANGTYVSASNINGRTIINFNSLSQFGTVSYDNNRREISLRLDGLNYNEIADLAAQIEPEWQKGQGGAWNTRIRALGNILVIKNVSTNINSLSTVSNLSTFQNRVKSGDLYQDRKDVLDGLRDKGYNIDSLFEEYYTKNGEYDVSVQIY